MSMKVTLPIVTAFAQVSTQTRNATHFFNHEPHEQARNFIPHPAPRTLPPAPCTLSPVPCTLSGDCGKGADEHQHDETGFQRTDRFPEH